MVVGDGRFEAMFAKIVNPLWSARTRALARCHFIFVVGSALSPFLFRSLSFHPRICVCVCVCACVHACVCSTVEGETSSHRNASVSPTISPLSLGLSLGFNAPFLFVAVDGISRQLELDLSNPRAIAPRPLFSPFHVLLPPPPFFLPVSPSRVRLLVLPRFRILGFPASRRRCRLPVAVFAASFG